jgi:hypothetical protein
LAIGLAEAKWEGAANPATTARRMLRRRMVIDLVLSGEEGEAGIEKFGLGNWKSDID